MEVWGMMEDGAWIEKERVSGRRGVENQDLELDGDWKINRGPTKGI